MSVFHTQVTQDMVPFPQYQRTVRLASGITAVHEGRALTQDGTNANQYRLAGDNDPIDARLLKVENRAVTGQLLGTISKVFIEELPIKSGETVTVGNMVVGAGSGEIKALAAAGTPADLAAVATLVNAERRRRTNIVVEVRTGFAVVEML